MRFVKFQAHGNDYIVIEARELNAVSSLGDFAKRICDAHYGAGADGIAIVENDAANFSVRIFNPDGSEAGLSGNGTRCAAAYIHYEGLSRANNLCLKTSARKTIYRLRENIAHGHYLFDSELGRPSFEPATIPFISEDASPIQDYPLELAGGERLCITALSVGNPHCAIFVESFSDLDWRCIGAAVERHPRFPERTNVEFIRVVSDNEIELRIWERGVGETRSSGTCASAAAVACALCGRTGRHVNVATVGGRLLVEWRAEDDMIVLTGGAEIVYEGVWRGIA